MHEMALMESLVQVLKQEAEKHHIQEIRKVKLVVGAMSNALPSALRFAFEVLRLQEPPLTPRSELEIEERETRARCSGCGEEFPVEGNYFFLCPACQSPRVEIIQGRELQIDYFEGD